MGKRRVAQLNALIAIDKPGGCTSHDVVARVRRAVGERRVGHAGTLDPMASGVLVVGIGQATRLLGRLTLDTKRYLAEIAFGSETATDDAEGAVTREAEAAAELTDEEFARGALAGILGEQMQVPPSYSAISVDGVRSYARARAGEEVELEARPITVHEAQLISIRAQGPSPIWTVSFTVSKGTYIRALARDLGRSLGSAAHLAGLVRTASGSVTRGDCLELDALTAEAARATALDPVRALGAYPLRCAEAAMADVLCGKRIPSSALERIEEGEPGCRPVALVNAARLVALGSLEGGCFVPTDVVPQPIEGVSGESASRGGGFR